MNLDELQSVQARERQSSDLQHLRSSFYKEVGEFIRERNEERARAVEDADDPFSEPEVRRLTDDIETAEGTVEAIYERRVGKVVKKASIAAAGMPVEDDGLTSEESALFESLVDRIEDNRERVLSVLDGDTPSVSCSVEETTPDDSDSVASEESIAGRSGPGAASRDPGAAPHDAEGVSAADLMGTAPPTDTETAATPEGSAGESPSTASEAGGDSPAVEAVPSGSPLSEAVPEPIGGSEGSPESGDAARAGTAAADGSPSAESVASGSADPPGSDTAGDVPGMPRTTVRITADVGEIVGADDRDYDLGTEDVVTLPEPNADVLVEKDAAERL
ncbi:DNA replication factor GINS [Natronomonas moolapensis 8.8.11]|uniref:DNA replication factor GINS n=1 Tax=Natronomonas moolapensis (strain DSM 18674 / CECT 7526 / JCM 14361 / 8.8.11) TaxID=268739 RepID=M1XPJ9_NATM8|nr:DNA replication factor GINS [Natronomonas moolapensis]CCQ35969.1 DNA replication factor GINS [Natronomonas moolapensis 8.8.11]